MNSIRSLPAVAACTLGLATHSTTLSAADPTPAVTTDLWVYVGTYTGPQAKGIHLLRFDPRSGNLARAGLASETRNPSFLALHPSRPWLYAVNEIAQAPGRTGGTITAFRIDSGSGQLTRLNEQSTKGANPCHVSVDPNGRFALVANYTGGSVAVFPIQADGQLGEAVAFVQHQGSSVNPRRQEAPHAHGIYTERTGRFVYVPDLGLDQVLVYRLSTSGQLTATTPPAAPLPPGSGPRHLAFHPTLPFAFVINELLSTLTVFRHSPDTGAIEPTQTLSTLPTEFTGQNSTAEIFTHPNGRFVYGSNRGHDSLAVFAFDTGTGRLAPVQHQSTLGKTPRNFALTPDGNWLLAANQGSDSIAVFRVDAESGKLTPRGAPVSVPSPVCLVFLSRSSINSQR